MRVVVAAVAILGGCGFNHGALPPTADATAIDGVPVDAAPDAKPANFHVRVEAHIDGRSELIFKGTTAQWRHYQFAAPGREQGVNFPTRFDTVEWFPVWPDAPTAENRDCDCLSSIYTELPQAVPRASGVMASVTATSTRVPPSIQQQPTADNDYTLIVELSDLGVAGSSWNDVLVDVMVP